VAVAFSPWQRPIKTPGRAPGTGFPRCVSNKLFRGAPTSNDGTELRTAIMPEGAPTEIAPERREELSHGLDADCSG
jgi:hypothetical protein